LVAIQPKINEVPVDFRVEGLGEALDSARNAGCGIDAFN
jgi:hypothetical protein